MRISPWWLVLLLLGVLILLIPVSWWRAAGTGAQVQVPMFYDAHYLFPRPWTQEQAAPGVPPPAPLAFYGANRVSQTFTANSDNLGLIELWLAGPRDVPVRVSLSEAGGDAVYAGQVLLADGPAGRVYRLQLPARANITGRDFVLTLAAPNATDLRPVVVQTVGGDRLGGPLRVNEFRHPGNLALQSYATGLPGAWWSQAVAEQMLPAVFRLRLQQYKPDSLKGSTFSLLLAVTAGFTFAFLVLASPRSLSGRGQTWRALGWALVVALALLLVWQFGSGRAQLRALADAVPLELEGPALAIAPPPEAPPRIFSDLSSTLWTARREPEARFVETGRIDGLPAIAVPGTSRVAYALAIPPGAQMHTGVAARGTGVLEATVAVNGQAVESVVLAAVPRPHEVDVQWLTADLSVWAGQGAVVELLTAAQEGAPIGLWIKPQLVSDSRWLLTELPDTALPYDAGAARFGEHVELLGVQLEPAVPEPGEAVVATLYWRAAAPVEDYASVFVHLLDEGGQILAQHDAQPVSNSYPLPNWTTGTIVADEHSFTWPADGMPASLAVGLYDPQTLQRWPAWGGDGEALADNVARFPMEAVIDAP